MRVGGTPAMASLEVVEPIEKDKGVYTFVMTDAEKTYTRTLELSGQGKKRCELTALIHKNPDFLWFIASSVQLSGSLVGTGKGLIKNKLERKVLTVHTLWALNKHNAFAKQHSLEWGFRHNINGNRPAPSSMWNGVQE